MRISGILVLVVLTLTPNLARAQARPREQQQKQAIAGTVVEDSTKVPIAGASVTVLLAQGGTLGAARADTLGHFRIPLDSAGQFRLRVEQPGYRTVTSDTISVDDEEVLTVELRLARAAIPLAPLVVTARMDRRISAFYDRVHKGGFGHFLTREEIERRRGQRPTELIRFMPGVRIISAAPCRGCVTENVVYLRGAGPGGSNECVPTVLIDGMEVKQDAVSPLNGMLMSEELEGVEVYSEPGTAPVDFPGMRSQCGVVAFWTRPATGKFSLKKLLIGLGVAAAIFLFVVR